MKAQRTFWLGVITGFGSAIAAFWVYALQEPHSAARTAVAHTLQWLSDRANGIIESGPVFQSLYLLMLLSFILSVFLSFRCRGTLRAFASALSPFIFGALALWLQFFPFAAHVSSGMYEGDWRTDVRGMQRPLESGLAMSAICLVLFFVTSNPRKPEDA